MMDKAWLDKARGKDALARRFLIPHTGKTSRAICTDRHRMHILDLPGTAPVDITDSKAKQIQAVLKTLAKQIQAALKTAVTGEEAILMDLWMPSTEGELEHFGTGTVIDEEYFKDAVDGDTLGWACFTLTTSDPVAHWPVMLCKGNRTAIIMPIIHRLEE